MAYFYDDYERTNEWMNVDTGQDCLREIIRTTTQILSKCDLHLPLPFIRQITDAAKPVRPIN